MRPKQANLSACGRRFRVVTGAVYFVESVNTYRQSGRSICFDETRSRPKRTRSNG